MISIGLSFLSAVLLILSFPRFDMEFLPWIGLIPLLHAVKAQSLRKAFGLSYLTGVIFFMGIFYWINVVSSYKFMDYMITCIYCGLYVGLFGLTLNFISKFGRLSSILIAPSLWVAMEYLRSNAGLLKLPWALLGYSQYLNLPLIQISSFTGVYGISFLIVMVNVILYEIIQRRKKAIPLALIMLSTMGLVYIYGLSVLSNKMDAEKINITVIQGNIPQDIKWGPEFLKQNLEKHAILSKEASYATDTSLIVWPEGAVPGPLTKNLFLMERLSNLAKETHKYLLIGTSQSPKFGSREYRESKKLNSAFLISPEGRIKGIYNKIYLLPFAEYLPYRDVFPWPARFFANASDFIPGDKYAIMDLNGTKFGVLICWENIFPELFRQFVKNGANFMVNITNEAWFGETAAPYEFVSMSVLRAVENRVSVVRSANTGISCFIDPYGRITGRVRDGEKDIFVGGYLTSGVTLSQAKTFYTLYGDIFIYLNIMAAIFVLCLAIFQATQKKYLQR